MRETSHLASQSSFEYGSSQLNRPKLYRFSHLPRVITRPLTSALKVPTENFSLRAPVKNAGVDKPRYSLMASGQW